MINQVAVIIPAAGNSGHMGSNKALLSYDEGVSIADHTLDCYRSSGCDPVVLVVTPTFDISRLKFFHFNPVLNHNVQRGRFYSIHLGLQVVPEGSSCFIHNIDSPFADRDLIARMVRSVIPDSYAVPVFEGNSGHPVILGRNVTDHFRRQQHTIDFSSELEKFPRIEVPFTDARILLKINTHSDYLRFREMNRAYRKKL